MFKCSSNLDFQNESKKSMFFFQALFLFYALSSYWSKNVLVFTSCLSTIKTCGYIWMFMVGVTYTKSFSAIIPCRDIKYKCRMYGRQGRKYTALRYRLDIFAVAIFNTKCYIWAYFKFSKICLWVKVKEKMQRKKMNPCSLLGTKNPLFISSKLIRFYFVNFKDSYWK